MARGNKKPQAKNFRIWLLRCGANPAVIPELLSCAALSSMPDWDLGSSERVECPDPSDYEKFIVYDEVKGQRGNAKLGIKMKYPQELAPLLAFARSGQRADVHILLGMCSSPEIYTEFKKILVLTYADPTKWSADKITAMQSGDNGSPEETIDLEGIEFYEIVPLTFSPSLAPELVAREVTGIDICQSPDCDDLPCPTPCQNIIAVQIGFTDEILPDELPSVVYSSDGGKTWGVEEVTTMDSANLPSDIRCCGRFAVVLDYTGNSYHYCLLADLYAGSPTWAEVTTGFVTDKLPNEGKFISGVLYIAADEGYIYRLRGVGSAVVVLDAGEATLQNLVDIDAVDSKHIVAVGDSNAVVVSDDGVNFELVVGPDVGNNLSAVCMLDARTWLVASPGKLWSTLNAGTTWSQEALPISMSITDIQHVGGVVYLSGVSNSVGVILRNTEGGSDALGGWYVLPEDAGNIPTGEGINKLAVCQDDYNLVYGAGLGTAPDGLIVRATP